MSPTPSIFEGMARRQAAKPQPTEKQLKRDAYRWNTTASMLLTAQSLIMLVIISHICDIYTAGVFTIAFTVGSLFMNMGWYGMRKFQVSDRIGEFTFREYRASRTATTIAMLVCSAAYTAFTAIALDYEFHKTAVIFTMCLFKAVEAYEDVYTGAYQQLDRLDIGAKMASLRQAVTMTVFGVLVIVSKDILMPLAVSTAFTTVFFIGQCRYVKVVYHLPHTECTLAKERVVSLLRQCFPLFVAAFLLFYLSSAPRYAINEMMNDSVQAYYGYISMPVFAVSVLAAFIYNPMIAEIADIWNEGKTRAFLVRFFKLSGIVIGITIVCDLLAYLFGVPVLNALYGTDVSPYLFELLVLVTGGGLYGFVTLATVGITIIRFQRVLVPLYVLLSIAAHLISRFAVAGWGITGASFAYFAIMGLATVLFIASFLIGVKVLAGIHAPAPKR